MTDFTPTPFDLTRSEPDWLLLGRLFRGECSAAEVDAITRWEAASPANAKLVAFMRRVWDEAAIGSTDVDDDDGWRAVQSRIVAARAAAESAGSARLALSNRESRAEGRPLHVVPLPSMGGDGAARRRTVWLRRALAAALGAVTVGGAMLWHGAVARQSAALAARQYMTARGQRVEVMLDDGTRVWLGVASRLSVAPGYGKAARDVELDGEAFFVVRHDAERPFRVHSRGAIAEDLGTEFGVRAYAEDRDVTVSVTAGLVVVRPDGAVSAGVKLARGQQARLDHAGHVAVSDGIDVGEMLAWRAGELRFDERPLVEVIPELERWYDLEIVLEDSSLARVPLTASIGRRNADQALAIIAGILDTRYVRTGRYVRLGVKPAAP